MITIALIIVLVIAIVALTQANRARAKADDLHARLNDFASRDIERLNDLTQRVKMLDERTSKWGAGQVERPGDQTYKPKAEPPPPVQTEPAVATALSSAPPPSITPSFVTEPKPPPLPKATVPVATVQRAMKSPLPKINLEQFIGANLMAWAAGLAGFLAVIFFVKYAFEHNLIPPSMRIAIGFVTGMALAFTGLKLLDNKRFSVMSQALAATGVLMLYGVTFAAHSLYRFPMFNAGTTFLLMSLITVVAFLMAVRMDAQVVAFLGMLGGFLTPPLCSSGQDNPLGLFTFIALLDAGLLAVARHKRWFHLAPFAAAGTALIQLGWMMKFFRPEHYDEGAKTWIVVLVFAGFAWLFSAAARWIRRSDPEDIKVASSAVGLSLLGMLVSFGLMNIHPVASRPAVMYVLILLVTGAALWQAWLQPTLGWAQRVMGALTFLHLAAWTSAHLTMDLLPSALALYLLFGGVYTAFAVVSLRNHEPSAAAGWTPVITLSLMMLPLFKLSAIPFLVWPGLLLANLMVIGLALFSKNPLPVLAALALTLLSSAVFLLKLPVLSVSLFPFLGVLGFFAVLFIVASLVLSRRLPAFAGGLPAEILPTASAVLPFGLLIMATLQLPVLNPAPVFGFALGLAVFLLVLARISTQPLLTSAAVVGVLGLEFAWHQSHFSVEHPMLALPWYLGFLALFTVYPMVMHPKWMRDVPVWIGSVVANLGSFALVHWLVMKAWPNNFMGIIPALFALPSLGSLVWVLRRHDAHPARLDQLAWLGGATLFFVTLIFPIQFDKQWLTVAWALEGAALCWLFQRVPHRGLLGVACGLLVTVFARLALNPAVLSYHERGEMMIWNWFLYSYSIAAASCFAAAKLLKPDERIGEVNLRGLFCAFGGVLLFLLMNIEIADAFTLPGERFIAFRFSGNIARDMTYTIGWAAFAVSLLMIGFKVRSRFTRYAGIGLMGAALLKLFFHDLADIDGIYRIGALVVVAVLGFASSYLYQRFADRDNS